MLLWNLEFKGSPEARRGWLAGAKEEAEELFKSA